VSIFLRSVFDAAPLTGARFFALLLAFSFWDASLFFRAVPTSEDTFRCPFLSCFARGLSFLFGVCFCATSPPPKARLSFLPLFTVVRSFRGGFTFPISFFFFSLSPYARGTRRSGGNASHLLHISDTVPFFSPGAGTRFFCRHFLTGPLTFSLAEALPQSGSQRRCCSPLADRTLFCLSRALRIYAIFFFFLAFDNVFFLRVLLVFLGHFPAFFGSSGGGVSPPLFWHVSILFSFFAFFHSYFKASPSQRPSCFLLQADAPKNVSWLFASQRSEHPLSLAFPERHLIHLPLYAFLVDERHC